MPDRRIVSVRDAAAMERLGRSLARIAEPGDLLCLYGDLGAGKTVLAKGVGLGLGVAETVISPSFILMAEYEGRLPLFHLDLYRLGDAADVVDGGLLDERQSSGVTVVEWAERLGTALPPSRLDVRIDDVADGSRRVELIPSDARHARFVEAAR
ncbi:MAG: tRNA (adenosine(37)-N6)-threonylcarbamoyltransferase complex ATPase subunit type 1 TsaE [Chloroflexi bacterium]|nr:tRNA (adenosine(37)-N6)-threonylcarbamoyltransferase complex ATPase subunit type 1 TsaE [Chloroflexota bacterium]